MIIHLLITGNAILAGAILANLFANHFNICTWYKFYENILANGLSTALIQQNIVSLCWLFVIYPIILSVSYILGEKIYQFWIQ